MSVDEIRGHWSDPTCNGSVRCDIEFLCGEIEKLQRQCAAMRAAIPFPRLTQGNAAALAFHAENGGENGGISRSALAKWLCSVSKQFEHFDIALAECGRDFIPRSVADELVKALKSQLRQQSNIEVLGEWEALDMNRTLRKSTREKVISENAKAESLIAAYEKAAK